MNSGKSEKTPKIALRHSRIGLRLLLNMLAALVLGVIVYIGVTQLGSWAQNSIIYERLFSEEYKQKMLHDLQNYVTDNDISSSDYMQISVWLSDNIGIGFFYDQRTPSDGDYVIQFADRAVSRGAIRHLQRLRSADHPRGRGAGRWRRRCSSSPPTRGASPRISSTFPATWPSSPAAISPTK